jgi:hypothetical protein
MDNVTQESLIADLRVKVCELFNMESLIKRNSVLYKKLEKLELLKTGPINEFYIQWLSIFMFIKNLDDIKAKDEAIFNKLRRSTLDQKMSSSWEGERFEVLLAKHLLEIDEIVVNKRESPDFSFLYQTEELFLEATIARLSQNKQNAFYKVSSAINKKSKKVYASKSTILSVDVTNIYSNYFSNNNVAEEEFYKEFQDYIDTSGIAYGAIILHCSLYRPDVRQYRLSYDYHVLPNCNEGLKEFLEVGFPMRMGFGYLNPIFPKEI